MEKKEDILKWNQEVIKIINDARTNPKTLIKELEELKKNFKGKNLLLKEHKVNLSTREGADAYDEAIKYLKNLKKLDEYKYNVGCARIAHDLVSAIQKDGLEKVDDIDINELIDNYGKFSGSFNRVMDFGGLSAKLAVINLVVSDGDKERGQRKALFDSKLTQIGVWSGKEPDYGTCTVIVMATKFTVNPDVEDEFKGGPKSCKEEVGKGHVDDDEDELEEGVVDIKRTEKIEIIKGKKMKVIKIIKTMQDGSKETETIKEPVD